MALLNCVKCNEPYSNSLARCPHCGFEPKVFMCPECGGIHGPQDARCPTCGFQLDHQNRIPAGEILIRKTLEREIEALESIETIPQAERNRNFLLLMAGEPGVDVLLEKNLSKLQSLYQREQQEQQYGQLLAMAASGDPAVLADAIALGERLGDFRDAAACTQDLKVRFVEMRYQEAFALREAAATVADWKAAADAFAALGEYRDASILAGDCAAQHDALKAKKSKKSKTIVLSVAAAVVVIALVLSSIFFFIPNYFYNNGAKLFANGQFAEAAVSYEKAGSFKDAADQAAVAWLAQSYADGEAAFAEGDYVKAEEYFRAAAGYQDALSRADESVWANHYTLGCQFLEQGSYQEAIDEFALANGYQDTDVKTKDATYGLAQTYVDDGELLLAAQTFQSISGHKDAAERVIEAATELMNAGKYSQAAEAFNLPGTDEGAKYAAYCLGMDAFQAGDYATASTRFSEAGGVEDASSMHDQSVYLNGIELLGQKNFTEAQTCFSSLGEYENAVHLANVCKAELKLADGYMNAAYELYKSIPKDLEVEGFDIPSRKAMVENAKTFASICGVWNCTKNYIESRNHYKWGSRWWNWYIDSPITYQSLTIKCYLNDDGTVRMTGEVTFYRFTNYSSYSSNCNATSTTKTFTMNNLKSAPSTIKVDSYTTITRSGTSSFRLKYSVRDDYSSNFYNTYNSDVTFGKKTTAY